MFGRNIIKGVFQNLYLYGYIFFCFSSILEFWRKTQKFWNYVRKFKKRETRNKNENQTKKTINVMWKRDDTIIIFVHQQQRKSSSNNYSGPEGLPQSVSSAPSAQSRVPSQSCSKRMQVEPDMQSNSPNGHLSGLKVVSGLIRVSLPPAANRGSSSISSIKTSDSRSTEFYNEPKK